MTSISFVYPIALWLLLLIPLTVGVALAGRRRPAGARFWGALGLRVCLLLLIVLALAGLQLRRPDNSLTAIFVLDVSDSIPAAEQARGEALIGQAIAGMPAGDRAAIVIFGQDALVERLASAERNLANLTSAPVTTRTNIAGALQLALALFPDEGAKRLVLLSDGRQNLGQALAQAELAAAHGIELVFVPLGGPQGEAEVLVEALEVPASVRQGQRFDLRVVVASTAPAPGVLRVWGDGQLLQAQEVQLKPGLNRFLVPIEATEPGFRRFRAQIAPDLDALLQNNEASAFTVVHGPPRVLLVEGRPGEGQNLGQALQAAGMAVVLTAPAELPTTLPELASFDAVILANTPAAALPAAALDTLPAYVRDLGRGLLMTGGENAFGTGGYLRTPLEAALPVDMDVRSREQTPNLALVLAVDKSGSMGRCHCDDPDLEQSYVRQEVGQPKVDIAKEAVMRAAAALGPQDSLGVVAFDEAVRWALTVQRLADFVTLERSIGGIAAGGQTNLQAGVSAAYDSLQGVEARRKHVILLTDGWVREGDLTALAEEMQAQGVTLSVVAAGGGSAQYLTELARRGGGRYYPAVDILQVPDLFLRETVEAVGRYIVEEPFLPLPAAPSPVLRGLDGAALPLLLGYNGATAKRTASVLLSTPQGDPLLATWQYGLGRAAAWTSDVTGRWAAAWVAWEGFGRFAAQLVGWTLPAPQVEGLSAQATLREGQAAILVEAEDEDGRPRNFLEASAILIGPDLTAIETPLEQTGPGRYEALAALSQPGAYLVRVDVRQGEEALGQQTLGLVAPYSPEYRAGGLDRPLLSELAQRTGGGELPEPLAAFLHNLPAAGRAREIGMTLLLIVALLFPLDVALRRVLLGRQEIGQGAVWLRSRLPLRASPAESAPSERALGRLFQARDRVRARRSSAETASLSPPPASPGDETPSRPPPAEAPPAEGETLVRLRAAKKRARRPD